MSGTIFVSYAHAPEHHERRVAKLVTDLRAKGLQVIVDSDVMTPQGPPEGWLRWMLNQLELARWVLVVCNEAYYERFRGRENANEGRGAIFEGGVIGQKLYDDASLNHKFIPVLLGEASPDHIPEPLRGATYYRVPGELEKLAAALAADDHGTSARAPRPHALAMTSWRRAMSAGVAVLVGVAILMMLFMSRRQESLPFTVFLIGAPNIEGEVSLDGGGVPLRAPIGARGEAFFPQLPREFRTRPVRVSIDVMGYDVGGPAATGIRLNGTSVEVPVRRKDARIRGSVRNGDGHPVVRASVSVIGFLTTTNSAGRFDVEIPGKDVQPDMSLQVVAAGYEPWHGSVVPYGGETAVVLSKADR
jgi:hypothetical protein